MGVRLNKVLSELNIGLQTAVDFLKKKSSLGEIKDDATPNTKINDSQYEALVGEFKSDKAIKKQAEMIFPKKKEKEKEKKKEEETPKTEPRQQFKPLGKIDLDSLNKRPAPVATLGPKETTAPVAAAESQVKEEERVEVKETVEVKPEPKPEPAIEASKAEDMTVVEKQFNPEPEKVVPETPVNEPEEQSDEAPENNNEPQETTPTTPVAPKVFTLKSEAKLAPKVNVLGKIDLDSLNQSTRPKTKSKEEKK